MTDMTTEQDSERLTPDDNKSNRDRRREFWQAANRLQQYYGIFHYLAKAGNPCFTLECPTAGVAWNEISDEIDFLINPALWDNLSDYEREFLISHEALHLAFKHTIRGKEIRESQEAPDHDSLNIAMDCVVNETLLRFGFDRDTLQGEAKKGLPEGCWFDNVFEEDILSKPAFKFQPFEKYYLLLRPQQPPLQMSAGGGEAEEEEEEEDGDRDGDLGSSQDSEEDPEEEKKKSQEEDDGDQQGEEQGEEQGAEERQEDPFDLSALEEDQKDQEEGQEEEQSDQQGEDDQQGEEESQPSEEDQKDEEEEGKDSEENQQNQKEIESIDTHRHHGEIPEEKLEEALLEANQQTDGQLENVIEEAGASLDMDLESGTGSDNEQGTSDTFAPGDLKRNDQKNFLRVIDNFMLEKRGDDKGTSWRQPDRRTQNVMRNSDLMVPERKFDEEGKPFVFVFLDTSGSCRSYARRIAKAAACLPVSKMEIRMFGFSTDSYEIDPRKIELSRFGGTDFRAIRDRLNEEIEKEPRITDYPDAVFVMTDGKFKGGSEYPSTEPHKEYRDRWKFLMVGRSTRQFIHKDCSVYDLSEFS